MSKYVCSTVFALALLCGLAPPAVANPARSTDYRPVIAKLNAEIPGIMRAGGTVGLTIALVDGQRTVWLRGFGWADRARRVPVTKDTLFHIGSVSKTMAAAAVMQLVEKGLVKLDAPLARYVPGFSLRPRYRHSVITVRSVLDHHSGIPGTLFNGLFTENKPDPGYRAWLLRTLRHQYPERPVNTAWAYNNSGYALLQNLVEQVTGEGFAAYTRQHLFDPMGMPSTTFDDAAAPASRLTHNYEAAAENGTMRVSAGPREYVNAWAAGSVVSSATDMAAYLKTLIAGGAGPHGRILRSSTLRQMITPQTDLPLDIMPYRTGLSWWIGDTSMSWMGTVVQHTGHTYANHTDLLWLPGSRLGVFVSANTLSPAAVEHQVAELALDLMVTAKTGRTPPVHVNASPRVHVFWQSLRRAAGRYAGANGVDIVRAEHGALVWTPGPQRPGAPSFTMTPRADGWYTANTPGPPSIKTVTVAGRRLLLARTAADAVSAFAERIPSTYRVPPAWRKRTGRYRAVNILPNTYPGSLAQESSLTLNHGVLLWKAQPGGARGWVLTLARPTLGFTFGYTASAAKTDVGDSIVADGNTLSILGVTYRRSGS